MTRSKKEVKLVSKVKGYLQGSDNDSRTEQGKHTPKVKLY